MRCDRRFLLITPLMAVTICRSQQPPPCVVGNSSNYTCGCVLDTWKTIPAQYNGSVHADSCGGVVESPIQLKGSLLYQCAEYARRFYYASKGVDTTHWNILAVDYFRRAPDLGLTVYPNCITGAAPGQPETGCTSNTLPQADDIVSFCRLFQSTLSQCDLSDPGHAAVIKGSPSINGKTFSVTLIEQNWSKSINLGLTGSINPDGSYTILDRQGACEPTPSNCQSYAYFRIQGWLRLPPRPPTHYSITDLGTLGGPTAVAHGINSAGQVVGEADTAGRIRHAFLWTNGSIKDLNAPLEPSVAFAINALNQVVGSEGPTPLQNPAPPGPASAFLWTSVGGIQTLTPLPGAPYTIGLAINAVGQIAGTSTTPRANTRAVVWLSAASAPQDIGGAGPSSLAYGINSSEQVVGWTNNWGGSIAFSWTSAGGLQDLGTLSGDNTSRAAGINDLGQVVGFSSVDGTTTYHAFLWTSSGGIQGLGTLGGSSSIADAINASEQVVGWANTASGAMHAFLSQNGSMIDLNTLISDPSWTLIEATAINDAGQIVGWGILNGQVRGYLLTPQ